MKFHVEIHTVVPNPGDKVLESMAVLDDGGDRVTLPLEVEGERSDITVRKTLHKVQSKHWRYTT